MSSIIKGFKMRVVLCSGLWASLDSLCTTWIVLLPVDGETVTVSDFAFDRSWCLSEVMNGFV